MLRNLDIVKKFVIYRLKSHIMALITDQISNDWHIRIFVDASVITLKKLDSHISAKKIPKIPKIP